MDKIKKLYNHKDIRKLVIAGFFIALLLALISISEGIINQISQLRKLEDLKTHSIEYAGDFKQDIVDITNSCNLYVLSGDTVWANKYHILVEKLKDKTPWYNGKHKVFTDSLRQAGISQYEINLLKISVKSSEELINTGLGAINAIKNVAKYGEDIEMQSGFEYAKQLITNDAYHKKKENVIHPLSEFILTIDKRINNEIANKKRKISALVISLIAILLTAIAISINAIFILLKRLRGKIKNLIQAQRITESVIKELEIQQKTIRQSEIKFKILFEESTNAILLYTKDGFSECNNAALKLFGCDTKEEVMLHQPAYFSPEFQPDGSSSLAKSHEMIALAEKNGTNKFDWIHRNLKTNETFPVEVSLSYIEVDGKYVTLVVLTDLTERKKAEIEIFKTQEQLKFLFDVLPVGLINYDNKGQVIETNLHADEIFGFNETKNFNLEQRLIDWDIHKHDGTAMPIEEYPTYRVLKGEEMVNDVEIKITTPSGKIHNVIVSARLLGVYGISETIIDVTNIKKAEEDLALLSQIVFNSLNAANIGAWWIDFKDVNLLHGLKNLTAITGLEEVTTNTYSLKDWDATLVNSIKKRPEYAHLHEQRTHITKQLLSGKIDSYSVIYPIITVDGKFKWIDERGAITRRNKKGKPLLMTGTVSDVTNQKKIEKELENAKQTLELAIDAANFGIWDYVIKNETLKWDGNSYGLYGFSNEDNDITFDKWLNCIYPDDKEKAEREVQEALSGNAEYHSEFRIIWPDKSIKYIRANGIIMRDENNKPKRMIGVHWDVSNWRINEQELKKAKVLAEEATMAKSIFLANMSHEIRTPMNAIIGFTDLLGREVKTPNQKNYIKSIRTSGNNLLELIDDILDLTKVEAGKLKIRKEPADTQTFFDEIKKLFAYKIEGKGLRFDTDFSETLPPTLNIDELRVKQVLINLIGNAVKFTDKGSIKLKVYCEKIRKPVIAPAGRHYVRLVMVVEDTGMGIKQEFIDSMYDSFSQQEGQSTRKYGGAGLGLSITKKLIQLMDGVIKVESKIGEGSTFTVMFHNVEAVSNVLPKVKENEFDIDSIKFVKGKVLFADDDSENRKLLSEIMDLAGLKYCATSNGYELLNAINRCKPDIILTDIFMPEMNGVEVLKAIRKDENLADLPVYAITASANYDSIEMLNKEDFSGVLTKPILVGELYKVLMNHIKYIELKEEVIEVAESIGEIDFDKVHLVDIIKVVDEELNPNWEKLRVKKPIDELSKFATKFISLGEQYKISKFIKYGENLNGSIESFNIEEMVELINYYPKMIEELRQQT